jgi:hypothetical protein
MQQRLMRLAHQRFFGSQWLARGVMMEAPFEKRLSGPASVPMCLFLAGVGVHIKDGVTAVTHAVSTSRPEGP